MILLSKLIGQQAISLATAERTGTVRGVVVEQNRIVAVELDEFTLDAAAVRTFEGDVLTYDTGRVPVTDRHGLDPRKKRVLDVHGDELGSVSDIEISADGTVETLVLDNADRLRGARLLAIGSYAAIVGSELPPPTGSPVR